MSPDPVAVKEDRLATEYLANERTFLAWIRTAIAIVSLGFVVSRFSLWLREMAAHEEGRHPATAAQGGVSLLFGDLMMIFGGLLAILAALRFHAVNRQIEQGKVMADRGLVALVAIMVAALGFGMAAYMISTRGW